VGVPQDLASGYVLGEIFYRCQMQPDFDKFVDRTHPDAMINNFTRLQVSHWVGEPRPRGNSVAS
jgi:hypothetical protein